MSCFKLPLSLCQTLDKHLARFWWGAQEGKNRIHWISWRNLCRSKHDGGLGFQRFEQFNQALLVKMGWRILEDSDSLLDRRGAAKVSFMGVTCCAMDCGGKSGLEK
ncbi:unnamed protein product [Linum trigynum]|uniref:Uncharacterized protein n=1 Tax=Linum trigynum TaxID=586398 RepID=A0AAV2FZF8_9ROSI